MKKITFFILIISLSFKLNAQCINTVFYPINNITAIATNSPQTIATDSFSGDYSIIEGLIIGSNIEFSITLNSNSSHGYITLIDNTDGSTVLDQGPSPLSWTITSANVQVHWSNDNSCLPDTESHTTSYTAEAPSCTGATQWPNTNVVAVNNGETQIIATDNFSGDYTVMTGLTVGKEYDFEITSGGTHGYITFKDITGATVLASGSSPFGFTPNTSNIQVHWNNDASCDTDTTNHTTTYLCRLPPDNDTCNTATPLVCGTTTSGSTTFATDTVQDGVRDVWYSYTGTGTSEVVIINLCTPDTSFNTFVAVLDSCDITNTNIIAQSAIDCVSDPGGIGFLSDGVSTYYIIIEGETIFDSGDFQLEIFCLCAPPIVSYQTADNCVGSVGDEFSITTTIESLGSASFLTVIDNQGSEPQVVSETGDIEFGPYPLGTEVIITTTNSSDSSCQVISEVLTVINCPPINDTCQGAIDINCGDSITASTLNATSTIDETLVEVWYTYTGNGNPEAVILDMCNGVTNFNTGLAVAIIDDCNISEGIPAIAIDDDGCGDVGGSSRLSFISDGVSTYTIIVFGQLVTDIGNFQLDISCQPLPVNDLCANAIAITCGEIINDDNFGSLDSNSNGQPEVWYSFTGTGTPEQITLNLCDNTDFSTSVSVYDTCDGNVVATDEVCGTSSFLTFTSNGISTYIIAVEGANGATGNFEMEVTCDTIPPPVNDICSGAIAVACNDVISGSTLGATDTVFQSFSSVDVWYTYTGSGTPEEVTLSLCNNTNFNTYIAVVDACNPTNTFGENDDACGTASEITFTSDGTTTYYIIIEGFDADSLGDFELQVKCGAPINSSCNNAIAVTCGESITGTNINATNAVGETSGEVWYSFTGTGISELVTLSLCDNTDFDTVIRVYDACEGNEIINDDDGCGGGVGVPSQVTFISDGTSTYLIAIEGYSINEGNFEMNVSCVPYTNVLVTSQAFLQGASLNPAEVGLMNDDLRAGGYLPLVSPYEDNATVFASVFDSGGTSGTGDSFADIVDWIWVELRDANDPTVVLASQSALLARDGFIVDLDGVNIDLLMTPSVLSLSYYVVIKHRNHLGIMSSSPVSLNPGTNEIDAIFGVSSLSIPTYGVDSQVQLPSGDFALWAGNTNVDDIVRYQGSNNDSNAIKDLVIGNPGNPENNNLFFYFAYDNADVNMDGRVRYQGSNNDSNIIKDIILDHPANDTNSTLFFFTVEIPDNN